MKKMISILPVCFLMILANFNLLAAGSGDVNSDGNLNIIDALMVAQYYVGMNPPGFIVDNADINDDGLVDIIDALVIARIYVSGSGPDEKILIPHPSWTGGMAGGIPKPEKGVLVLEADLQLERIYNMGETQYGQRQVCVIQSGIISGSGINGNILSGGLDFELLLSNGALEIEQLIVIHANDGSYIYLRNAGTAISRDDIRMVPDFEAPNNSIYSWLNSGQYVGRRVVDPLQRTMRISVYDISGLSINPDPSNSATVSNPANVPDQPWDYRVADPSERNGNLFITENVTLGASQSVGNTKRGNRNIIPITGGTVTGSITATILAAGADFQNLSNPMTIDARYLWLTQSGELIIVRNGGQFGSLVPTFEVRTNSEYSQLNNRLYLSSNPGGGAGGVQITFYESQ